MAEEDKQDRVVKDESAEEKKDDDAVKASEEHSDAGKPKHDSTKDKITFEPAKDEIAKKKVAENSHDEKNDKPSDDVAELKAKLAELERQAEVSKTAKAYGVPEELLEKANLSGDNLTDFAETLKKSAVSKRDDTSEAVKEAVRSSVKNVGAKSDPWKELEKSISSKIFG